MITYHRGNTYPLLEHTLVKDMATKVPHDLTGGTVTFSMWKNIGGKPSSYAKIDGESVSIVNATAGDVRFSPTAVHTDTLGKFLGSYTVTYSNGKILTFPENGWLHIEVIR